MFKALARTKRKFRYFLGLNHKRESVKVHKGVLQANTLFLGLSYDSLKSLLNGFAPVVFQAAEPV